MRMAGNGTNSGLVPAEAVPNSREVECRIAWDRIFQSRIETQIVVELLGYKISFFLFQSFHDSHHLSTLRAKRGPSGDFHGPK